MVALLLALLGAFFYSACGSPSDSAAFTTYAFQRTRALTGKGTAALNLACPSSRGAPDGLPLRGALPLAASMPRSLFGLLIVKFSAFSHLHLPG